MRAARIVLAGAGVLLLGWGAWLLLSRQDLEQLFSVAVWLAGVVVVHDGLVAALSAVRHRMRRSDRPRRSDGPRRSDAMHEPGEGAS